MSTELLGYTTYGGWSDQRPAHGTLGRFSQEMTTLQQDGRTFRLGFKFDRASYQLFRAAMVDHQRAMDDSLLCPSWSGTYNTTARGVWEFDLKAPATDRVELVAMLWPQDDKVWPKGEINILEGRVGDGRTMTNLHWPDPETGKPDHLPLMVDVDVSEWHRYRLEVDAGKITWSVDGRVVRELESSYVPHDVPVHLVVQAGVNPAIMDDWHENIWWEQEILFRRFVTICQMAAPRASASSAASCAFSSMTSRPPPSLGIRITIPRPSALTSRGPSPVRGFIAAMRVLLLRVMPAPPQAG